MTRRKFNPRTQKRMDGPMRRKDHPLYYCWCGIWARCNDERRKDSAQYLARGIYVAAEWQDFWVFVRDVGERPPNTTLDRINNDGPYSPGNCRWSTMAEQGRNTRRNRVASVNGMTKCLEDWAIYFGVHQSSVWDAAKRYGLQESIEMRFRGELLNRMNEKGPTSRSASRNGRAL